MMRQFKLKESGTILSQLVSPDGSIPIQNQNKLVLSLINLEQNSNQPYNNWGTVVENNVQLNLGPPLRFDIDLIMAACFDDYEESLKFLNAGIAWFQASGTFDVTKYPNMPKGLPRIVLEIETLNHKDMHSLWSALGAKYMPSIIYKMKMITIDSQQVKSETAMGTGFSSSVAN
jgi:hypothetical protein